MVPVLVNFPLLCLELHFFIICRHLEIWISKIARISGLCTSCSFSRLPIVASTTCWWEWCDKVLFNILPPALPVEVAGAIFDALVLRL